MRKLRTKLYFLVLLIGLGVLELSCKADTRTPEEIAQDERITQRVLAKLLDQGELSLGVTTERGVVHLKGVVKNRFMRDKAIELVKSVEGVKAVTENIQVEPEGGGY